MTLDTKQRLMDVAENLVRRNGADGFSYADLSAQVGIRKASIHYHFPTKSDLLTAIMVRYSERVSTALEAFCDEFSTPTDRLTAFIKLYRDALGDGSTLCL